jgi:ABC-type polysaccharide/polyol phosphate transport system ATPase subunit
MKTYSSGMFSRLAFSVAMNLDPDVLLLDEILAVGDASFQVKSMEKMRELLDQAGTILFVSHSLNSVEEFCDRAIWLDKGEVAAQGEAGEVVEAYRKSVKAKKTD